MYVEKIIGVFLKILPIMWVGLGEIDYLVMYLHISDEEYIS